MDEARGKVDVSFDRKGLLRDYRVWPETGLKTLENVPQLSVRPTDGEVYLAGMGASSAPGELLKDALRPEGLDIHVVRSHMVPPRLSGQDLLVAVSLSGNTEETAYLFDRALDMGCKAVAISSGGYLQTICRRRGADFVTVEGLATARSSLPSLLARVCQTLDFAKPGYGLTDKLKAAFLSLRPYSSSYSEPGSSMCEPAEVALWLHGATQVVAYHSPYAPSVGFRLKNVMSENAKLWANVSDIMDVMHDGITSWEQAFGAKLLLLRDSRDDDVIRTRFDLIGRRVESLGFQVKDMPPPEGDALSSLLASFYLLDLSTVYLALLRRLDPGVTMSQGVIKQELNRYSSLQRHLRGKYGP